MENDNGNYILLMIDLFKHINMVVESYDTIMTALYSKIDKYEYFVQQIYIPPVRQPPVTVSPVNGTGEN